TGMEFRHAHGASNDVQYRNNAIFATTKNGGTQQIFGPFVGDGIAITPRANISMSFRWDHWRNRDLSGSLSTKSRYSPKLGGTFRFNPNIAVHASGYDAFRA